MRTIGRSWTRARTMRERPEGASFSVFRKDGGGRPLARRGAFMEASKPGRRKVPVEDGEGGCRRAWDVSGFYGAFLESSPPPHPGRLVGFVELEAFVAGLYWTVSKERKPVRLADLEEAVAGWVSSRPALSSGNKEGAGT